MRKKLLAMLLTCAMLSGISWTGSATASAAEEGGDSTAPQYEKTDIETLSYNVTVSGLKENDTKLKVQTASWNSPEQVFEKKEGTYDLTFSFDSPAAGMKNMGYVYDTVSTGEDGNQSEILDTAEARITVNHIMVNGDYKVEVGADLKPEQKDLKNIWAGLKDGDKVYEGEKAYFAYSTEEDGIIYFYTPVSGPKPDEPEIPAEMSSDRSMEYVKAMGNGWNLGNSLECPNDSGAEPDKGEEEWGNPAVTKELIQAAKAKGFDNIRIPLTINHRYTVNENAKDGEYKYIIKKEYLDRAKEVIGWALSEDLYVLTNLHHDSWTWLKYWDGVETSEEYRKYKDFWGQLAEAFKDESDKLCFETINEYDPVYPEGNENIAREKVTKINQAAYDVIRASGGNNGTRMIVMPTFVHNHEEKNSSVLSRFILSLNDPNLIATVHYYSEWVYASNIGKTGFDEVLYGDRDTYTPRKSIDSFMEVLNKQFLSKKIGVIVSEYGVLGYDTGESCMQLGEEMKYYDYMNETARQNNVCLQFWDNGSAISRKTYEWKNARIGAALEKTMENRISYAAILDTMYFDKEVENAVEIPLTLNGNKFKSVEGLTDQEYTYKEEAGTIKGDHWEGQSGADLTVDGKIILSKDYVNGLIKDARTKGIYGTIKDLEITFDNGYVWHEYLVYHGTPSYKSAEGTKARIDIPFDAKGSQVRRITAYQGTGENGAPVRVGPNSGWWNWLQYGRAFDVNYEKGQISFLSDLFNDGTVKDGALKAKIEFYDGQFMDIEMNVAGDKVTCTAKGQEQPPEDNKDKDDKNNGGQTVAVKPAKKGTVLKDKKAKGIFKVTDSSSKSPKVSYTGTKNVATAVIPSTITDSNGIVYKVTSVAKNAFKGNKKLKKVKTGKNITSIGANAFKGCVKLSTVTLGSSVTSISDQAFSGCTRLTKIVIPKKVSKIGKKAFFHCKALKKVTIKTQKLTSKKTGNSAFKGISEKAVVKAPKSKVKAYKKLLKAKGAGKQVKVRQ